MSDWKGCYDSGWQGEIVPEAFGHPAKFSRGLIRRIYQHAFVEGWLVPGNTVVDVFGGVALGALDAMWNGLNWVGVELEPRFVALADANLDLWRRKYGSKPGFGSARIIQGDSRRLCEIISSAVLVCASPPYSTETVHDHGLCRENFANPSRVGISSHALEMKNYGTTHGQLGAMREGEFAAVISSPPYNPPMSQDRNGSRGGQRGTTPSEKGAFVKYGNTPGQLEGLPMGTPPQLDCVISSPPYAGNEKSDYLLSEDGKTRRRDEKRSYKQGRGCFR